ncbi:hypothetical protein K7711_02730 [Nocardia sp. CA2R105]|uniref:hypothetical protein n=1 Tax=Nocardia coffeae TaxID=2873381 RepID=UPI001CA732F3|nr:hypothetical protein [Nocardia coffeae]MBY8855382.1 hypothetical protein [Nocardia coffeae]
MLDHGEPRRYRYQNLTAAISDKSCPLRQYFDERFPNRRPVQDDYRNSSGALSVDLGTAAPGTVGAAFDFMIRASLDAEYVPDVAVAAFSRLERVAAIEEVARVAGGAARPSTADVGSLARAAWALALCTEVYRNPLVLVGGSPLAGVMRGGRFDAESLLALATDDAVEELTALHDLAVAQLGGLLAAVPRRLALGPRFVASHLCNADADAIIDGLLIELKVKVGGRPSRKTGKRSDRLSLAEIYQMVGYALFDTTNQFGIHTVTMYSARYGVWHQWPLQQLLETLAGDAVDVTVERARVWELLGGA